MKYGVGLGRLNPAFWVAATEEADRLGYESVWLPEHLVFPVEMSRSPFPGEDHPPVPPDTPVFDAFGFLSFLAGRTERIRLATHVYNLALRHPFVAARAVQTLDLVSGGRAICGVGASWLESEWHAAELDFKTRGRRLDEALEICQRLWTEEVVEHHGEFFEFPAVMFEPKPVQRPWPPIHIGGESDVALRRAARFDGWVGMEHTVESVTRTTSRLRELREANGRSAEPFEATIGVAVKQVQDVAAWAEAGVDRIIVTPWGRSPEAVEGLRRFAEQMFE